LNVLPAQLESGKKPLIKNIPEAVLGAGKGETKNANKKLIQ